MMKIQSPTKQLFYAFLTLFCMHWAHHIHSAVTRLTSSDPHPMFTTLDPQEFIYTWEKLRIMGVPWDIDHNQTISVSFSPFSQTTCVARNAQNNTIPLGDINGRWNMIALMFGQTPGGYSLPPALQCAANQLFSNNVPSPITSGITCPIGCSSETVCGCSTNPTCPLSRYIDPAQNVGNFSVPLYCKKRGLRLQFQAMLGRWKSCYSSCSKPIYKESYSPCSFSKYSSHWGIEINTGIADIVQNLSQTCLREIIKDNNGDPTQCCKVQTTCGTCYLLMPGFHNRTCCTIPTGCPPIDGICNPLNLNSIGGSFTATNINEFLMKELHTIANQIGLDISKFHRVSPEDININFFWRHAYFVNKGRTGWPAFLAMPYIELGGILPTGHKQDPNKAFSLPFGNNGHWALGGLTGLDLNFVNSVTFGAEVGGTYFFKRSINNFRVPNSIYQQGIFPFTTDVTVTPGFNWHFAGKMAAYHFLDRLSFYFQYLYVHHENDSINLRCCDCAFLPEILEKTSCWTTQMANIGFTYDLSPNISLGFLWQTPTVQYHAYRPTTLMFTFHATF